MYLGEWQIDDVLTFTVTTHTFSTGAATDADAVPAYRVYEDETGTAILTGDMAKLDDANTTGHYSEQITLSAANGFEEGKSYSIYISAAVDSVTGTTVRSFQVEAAKATAASIAALNNLSAAQVNAEVVDVLRTDTLPDSYAADGAQPTIAQALLMVWQYLSERAVSGTTVTVKKPDGTTSAMTFTLDDGTNPTSITRAS